MGTRKSVKELYEEGTFALEEISIEVSSRCMARCLHCSSGAQIEAKDDMDPQKAVDIIWEARELGATVLSLSGGDPLIYPYSFKLVSAAEDAGYEKVMFYTSGLSHISPSLEPMHRSAYPQSLNPMAATPRSIVMQITGTDKVVPDVLAYDLHKKRDDFKYVVIFSLHSAIPASHDFIMQVQGAWYNSVSIIHFLTNIIGTTVEVHTVPMAPTVRSPMDLDILRDLLNIIGVRKMNILRFVPQTRGKAHRDWLEMSPTLFARLQQWIHETQSDDHPVEVRIGCPFDFRHAVGLLDEKAKPCHAGHDLVLIRPNGDVHPCAAWKTLTKANINQHSLKWILENSETFVTLREHHKVSAKGSIVALNFDHAEACRACIALDTCSGGCPAQRLHNKKSKNVLDIWKVDADPMCPRVNAIPRIRKR